MKTSAATLLLATLLSPIATTAQMTMSKPAHDDRPVLLVPGLGNSHHTIHTSNPEAQKYFTQGLDYIYAFNHEEARRSFQKAADLDPRAAMPLWGVALAVGPNYNDIDIGHTREQAAVTAITRAKKLAASGPAAERDYIQTLSQRYAADSKHDLHVQGLRYSKGMAALVKKYPDDLDTATLYAESLMDLNPWKLWSADGKPAPGTELIVATLQGVLHRDPNHIGANHFLIHAVEASPNPDLALASADRLNTLAPAAGHLVHMPAHIYQRVGNFDGSATANANAIVADQAYFTSQHIDLAGEMYYDMYYVHNIHFLASACSMEGNAACTEKAAAQLAEHVTPAFQKDKQVEWFLPTQPWMLVRFAQWDKILATPFPPADMTVLTAMWHYARGCAYVGQHNLSEARQERTKLSEAKAKLDPKAIPDFNNSADSVYTLALTALDARILEADGQLPQAITAWQKAVTLLDTFAYNEPSDWYYPIRESLGGALLRNDQPVEAEAVFRRDLKQNPGSGRSLYGLWQSLAMQHRDADATLVKAQFDAAWSHATITLHISAL